MDGEGGITAEGLKPDEVPEVRFRVRARARDPHSVKTADDQSVVLENLSHLYTHPSIMDVKLGTVLAGPDAPPEKQARMEAQAKGSTSWETGVRLTGCQVRFRLYSESSIRVARCPAPPPSSRLSKCTDSRHGMRLRKATSLRRNRTGKVSQLLSSRRESHVSFPYQTTSSRQSSSRRLRQPHPALPPRSHPTRSRTCLSRRKT